METFALIFIAWIVVMAVLAGWLVIRERRKEEALRRELDRLDSLGSVESHREVR